MNIYADSSFLVAIYLRDRHTPETLRRIAQHPRIWITPFHKLELTHAIAQNVFRGVISAEIARQIYAHFAQDCAADLWHQVDLPEAVFETGIALARAHVPRIGARTLDTLHVAAALELKAERFWTFDERQAKLAKRAGLKLS